MIYYVQCMSVDILYIQYMSDDILYVQYMSDDILYVQCMSVWWYIIIDLCADKILATNYAAGGDMSKMKQET